MKQPFIHLTLLSLFAISAARADEQSAPTDQSLAAFAKQRKNAVRVTQQPVKMSLPTAISCRSYTPTEIKRMKASPHFEKYAHVFVSQLGEPAMRSFSFTNTVKFPVGSIVLKEKFSDTEGKHTELFTGMVKRESGYNTECGDWEFFTLSGNAKQVTSRGKLQSCMDCHVDYKHSDFVTKEYPIYSTK